jgi:hypothetical protein
VTLTGQLDRTGSPLGVWVRQHLPGTRQLLPLLRRQLGGDPAAAVPALAQPYPEGWEPGRQATAHEIRLRASLARPDTALAARMAKRLPERHAAPVAQAVTLAGALLDKLQPWELSTPWLLDQEAEEWLARCCWLLAQLETAWRRAMHDPAGPLCAGHPNGSAVLAAASAASVQDLTRLAAAAAAGPFPAYRKATLGTVTLSPVPSGQRLVGGADGDLLIGGTLVEVKTVASLQRIRNLELWQLALYVLLDDGHLEIDQVALYLGRHARLATWSIDEYLTVLARQPVDIDALRQSLRTALTPHSP